MPFYKVTKESIRRVVYERTVLAHDEADAIALAAEPQAHPKSYDEHDLEIIEEFPAKAEPATCSIGAAIPHEYKTYGFKCSACHGEKFSPWSVHDDGGPSRLCTDAFHGDPLKDPPPTRKERAADERELTRAFNEAVYGERGKQSVEEDYMNDDYVDPAVK